jgi:hypothetical protein
MNFNLKVIDNVISDAYQEYIKNEVLNTNWFYKNLSEDTPKQEEEYFVNVPGFSNLMYSVDDENVFNRHLYNIVMPLAHMACENINYTIKDTYFVRTFLQQPVIGASGLSNPHVDMINEDHLVCLYYVLTSDGDTVFFDEKSESNDRPSFKEYNIIESVTPKQGRVVLFNGRNYHANILPQQGIRSVINFCLGGHFNE